MTASKNPLENIKNIQSTTTSGLMISDGYGGGTANMEFQSITGIPMTNFNSNISVLFSEISPRMSLVPSLSHFYQPENRLVLHLNSANNHNRSTVYQKLNFSKFIAIEGTDHKPKVTEKYGTYPSDQAIYQIVLNHLKEGKHQFIYALTIQNHGPYLENGGSYDISASNFTASQNKKLEDYANRLAQTDRVTIDFLNQLKAIDKPISVVFYGDHLSGFYPTDFFKSNDLNKQTTEYFIWSNKTNKILNYPLIRSNDFTALSLETTESQLSPYYALLRKNLPSQDSVIDEVSAEDLKLIQYDLTVGHYYLKNYPQCFKING
ncbi:LTA synthase family protein [Streptococcus catagoni]|uniref:LTA synthase family protein n=1 Tax=Streptococcus catagoni TaxID=2654874 RepID=UPI001408666D|nr:LTA synthase family protein [Streptococcus catagoni]